VDILVACPGRLEDLIAQRVVDLSMVEIVVIDEADRMADMGFLPAVRRILDATAKERQTILFSATLDGDVGVITRSYQRDAVRHEVPGQESDAMDAEHRFEAVQMGDRLSRAAEVIGAEGPTIVFCRTRHGADKIAKKLGAAGVPAAPIHGGLSQGQRDRALASFTRGSVHALVATDVAALGIHVDDVACVLHFDPPTDAKTYVHRSGRTARKGASGVVVSFLAHDQMRDERCAFSRQRRRSVFAFVCDLPAHARSSTRGRRGIAAIRRGRTRRARHPLAQRFKNAERRARGGRQRRLAE
jgi:superfamily II DNA/RNA helicase